jgi:hypothetical protein
MTPLLVYIIPHKVPYQAILKLSFTSLTLGFRLELDTLSEESYKDSTLIMQLLRDNLVRLPSAIYGPVGLTKLYSRPSGPHLKQSLLLPSQVLHTLSTRRLNLQRRPRQKSKLQLLALMFGTSGTSDRGRHGLCMFSRRRVGLSFRWAKERVLWLS